MDDLRIIKAGKLSYIYGLVDPILNQVKYIGKTDNPKNRLNEHLRKSKYKITYKNNWINSLKEQNLKPEFIIIDMVPENEWIFWEQHYISLFKSWGFKLTNMTEGGEGGNFGLEINKKISEKLKNRIFSDETLELMSKAKLGSKASEETKEKLSLKLIGNKRALGLIHTEETKLNQSKLVAKENNPMFGTCAYKKWIEKYGIEEANKKLKDTKAKLSEKTSGENNGFYGKTHNKESLEKMYEKVIQKNLNGDIVKIWDSFTEAAKTLNINQCGISNVCDKPNRTYKGFKWEKIK